MPTMQPTRLTLDTYIDHAAKWHPDAAIVTGQGAGAAALRTTYAALRERSVLLSGALDALGLGPGDMLATLAWNSEGHLASWYAAMGVGMVVHTLNPRLSAAHLAAMLDQSRARVLAVGAGLMTLANELVGSCPWIEHLVLLDGDEPGEAAATCRTLDALIGEHGRAMAWGGFDETTPAGLCFTSGTTGAPKGVLYTHRSNYLQTMRMLQADALAITGRDVVMPVVPMFHANGWGLPFAAPAVGARLVLPGRHADGASLAELIASEGVTVAIGVPTVWLALADHLEATGASLPSLKRILVGGAAIPQALFDRLEQRLGVIVQTSWGMTEMSPLGSMAPADLTPRRASSVGRVPMGGDLLLTDAAGVPLAEQRGVEGHLRVRGGTVVERYFGREEPAVDADGWFDTGDLAVIDAEGNLSITGRAKDLIKSGGEWINPVEMETIVGAMPGVALAAVIGRSHPKWGERPILLWEAEQGSSLSDDDLRARLKDAVASWWMPDAVIRLDRIPLAATGKIDKQALRRRYAVAEEVGEAAA